MNDSLENISPIYPQIEQSPVNDQIGKTQKNRSENRYINSYVRKFSNQTQSQATRETVNQIQIINK